MTTVIDDVHTNSASSSQAPNSLPVQSVVTTNADPLQETLTLTVLHPPQSATDAVPANVVELVRFTVTTMPSTFGQIDVVLR